MPEGGQAGAVLADRYRLEDLLAESRGGRFWLAYDTVLQRSVAVHVIPRDDERADGLIEAAKRSGPVADRRILRVLDAEVSDKSCWVVNEWGQGISLDALLQREGPLPPRRVSWLVAEVADTIAHAHSLGLAHGRLVPENVLIDDHGQVRIIGFGVDAALLGLPQGRQSADVTDLVALLYCGLTGKWPGVSSSLMPAAPVDHGHVLRPRQVRAGIPRTLDALCDQVLNPMGGARTHRFDQDLTSARGIGEVLSDYLGDPGSTHGGVVQGPARPVSLPPEPSTEVPPEVPVELAVELPVEPHSPEEPETVTTVEPTPTSMVERAPASSAELPTQAGMPVFHDDSNDVEWLRARTEPPEPPPPFAEATPKPLFAPDPPEGEPLRRPRPGARVTSQEPDYWPWDSSNAGPGEAVRSPGHTDAWSTGTGSWGSGGWSSETGSWSSEPSFDTGEHVPGRSWNRLALIIGACVLVLIAVVAAYHLNQGGADPEDPPPSTGSEAPPTSAAAPTPFEGVTADDFDPQGSPPAENPEQAPLVVDGDAATTWQTSTYKQNLGPQGLKTGVGLVLDLGATKGVRQVTVTTTGGDTAVAAYVTGNAPNGIADLTPVGVALGSDTLTIALDEAISGRYVTLWFTSLPAVEGGFRGTVSEVQVFG